MIPTKFTRPGSSIVFAFVALVAAAGFAWRVSQGTFSLELLVGAFVLLAISEVLALLARMAWRLDQVGSEAAAVTEARALAAAADTQRDQVRQQGQRLVEQAKALNV